MAGQQPPSVENLLPVRTSSAADTIRLGERIAETLHPGTLVALYGSLGSGKTQLAKGICRFFGIDETRVTSPTFTIVNEYTSDERTIYHIDAYRIRRLDELLELGFDSYLDDHSITIIEWSENIEAALPSGCMKIRLSHTAGNGRLIEWKDGRSPEQ